MTTPKAYNHREAFCLMLYRDTAGNEEWIWNSRDGVTPYAITSRQGLEARHTDWERDRCVPGYKAKPGERIFVDLTIDRARAQRREYVERLWDFGAVGDRMCDRYASRDLAVEQLAQDVVFGGGPAPDLIEVPASTDITVLWFDRKGCGPDEFRLELNAFPSEKDGAIPAYLGMRVRAGDLVIGAGALVDGGFILGHESAAELHRQLGEWLAATKTEAA